MQTKFLNKSLATIFIAFIVSYAGSSSADIVADTLDPDGTVRNFIGVASVNCTDNGSGAPDNLTVKVRDNSPPVSGLIMNLQIAKDDKANSVTDTISGDAEYSQSIALQGGAGLYWMVLSKTDVGARGFDIDWQCNTVDGVPTGSIIEVTQFGAP